MNNIVTLRDLIHDHNLEVIYMPIDKENTVLTEKSIDRAGMSLLGLYDFHNPNRLQMMGLKEAAYLRTISEEQKVGFINNFLPLGIPALIVTNNAEVDPVILKQAEKHSTPILRTQTRPSKYAHDFFYYMSELLSPKTTISGVLVEVHGEGVLIMGESGIGKSETALELVKRGHRLIADDAVDISLQIDKSLLGTSPKLIRHFLEIRGIGIIDVKELFGLMSVMEECRITMAVKFVHWENNAQYEQLGLEDECETILGVPLPLTTIPVRHGRNLAFIVETAAINKRAKLNGYNSAKELDKNLISDMMKKIER